MKKNPNKQTIITQANFARRLKVNPQRVTKLIEGGIIDRRPDGRLDLEDSLAKAQTYLKAQAEAQALHSGKNALITRKLLLQCERLQIENDRERGRLHDRDECTMSLTAILSATSHELHGVGRRLKTAFPETDNKLIDAIDGEIDESLGRLRSGLAYRGEYFCPACNHKIGEYTRRPLVDDAR